MRLIVPIPPLVVLALLLCTPVQAQGPVPLVPMAPAVTPEEPPKPPEPPPTYPFQGETPLNFNDRQGRAYLFAPKAVLKPGERLTLSLTFENTSDSPQSFYNPFFSEGLLISPGKIAAYDAKHHLLEDMRLHLHGSYRNVTSRDWINIPPQAFVGFRTRPMPLNLPPGVYYFQMIYFRLFANDPPNDEEYGHRVYSEWDRHVLFRSNPVTIRIVAPQPAGRKPARAVHNSPKVERSHYD